MPTHFCFLKGKQILILNRPGKVKEKQPDDGSGPSSYAQPGKIASCCEVMGDYKFQITNIKYQTNNNDQNSKFQTCFGH
jgi:hypothetical protein